MNDRLNPLWTARDDRMVEAAIRSGASRRDLLRLLAVGGLAAASAGTIFGRASAAVAATPVSGGSLVAAGWSTSTADTLDPAKASLSTDYVRCCAFYNRLTFLDEQGVTQMELAESIDSKDAKTWTVKLRRGVTFHDGTHAERGGRRLLPQAPCRSRGRLQGRDDRQADDRRFRRSTRTRCRSCSPRRTPTCRPSSRCITS